MRKKSKWGDFWFTICVRVICGIILGGLAGVFFGASWRARRGILWHLAHDDVRWVVIWMGLWIVGGAVASVFTIPHWQWPWYRGRDDNDDAA